MARICLDRAKSHKAPKRQYKEKKKRLAIPAVYGKPWNKIKKSKHIRFDRERANRYNRLTLDDYIVLTLWQPIDNIANLYMSNGSVLIVALNERAGDMVITVIPTWKHIRKLIIEWGYKTPVIRKGD